MALCKDTEIKKVGCKIEDLTANPPVLLTNFVPDVNGVTHHNPLFCAENKPPQDLPIVQPNRTATFKNRKIVANDLVNETLKDGFRDISAFLWNVRNTINGEELYHVWTQGLNDDNLLNTRRLYNIIIHDDQSDNNSNLFGARKASIAVVGQLIQGSQTLSNGQRTTVFAPPGVDVDPQTGFELFSSFDQKMKDAIKTNRNYQDVVFSTLIPFDEEDIERFTIFDNNRYKATWDFNYNFLVQPYEDIIADPNIPVQHLPNLYVWFSELFNRQGETYTREFSVQRFYDLINLGGAITIKQTKENKEYPKSIVPRRTRAIKAFQSFDVTSTEEFRYFEEWGRKYQYVEQDAAQQLLKQFGGTIVTSEDLTLMNTINGRREFFPMLTSMTFPTQDAIFRGSDFRIQKPFLAALTTARLDDSLLLYVLQNIPQFDSPLINLTIEDVEKQELTVNQDIQDLIGENSSQNLILNFNRGNFNRLSYVDTFKEQDSVSLKKSRDFSSNAKIITSTNQRRVWNISKWIELFNSFEQGSEKLEKSNALQIFDTKEPDIATFLGSHPLELKKYDAKSFKFFKTLMFLIFSSKIKNMLKATKDNGQFRTVDDMFSFGKECHSEQIFFRVSKRRMSDNAILQNFYFPNSMTKDVLTWLDSQVKYGVDYKYEVFSYNLVLGTEYNYTNLVTTANKGVVFGPGNTSGINNSGPIPQYAPGSPLALFDIEYHPQFILIEQPYFEFMGKVLDNPPVPPELDFVPFIDVDDRIQINLRSNIGEILAKPIVFSDDEQDFVDQLIQLDGKIKFKNDDPVSEFEVFRLEGQKPKALTDFIGNSFVVKSNRSAPAASFMERIRTNVKYYYIFRSIDSHGHKSNPTPIYEIELVDDGGFIYLETNIISIEEVNNKESTKSFNRYMKIIPSILQSSIDLERSSGFKDAMGNIAASAKDVFPKVGLQDEDILDKRFKIRLTSKKSGKKIDINFKVQHKHDN